MWAHVVIAGCAKIAIRAFYTNVIGETAFDDVTPNRDGISSASSVQIFAMFSAPATNMADG